MIKAFDKKDFIDLSPNDDTEHPENLPIEWNIPNNPIINDKSIDINKIFIPLRETITIQLPSLGSTVDNDFYDLKLNGPLTLKQLIDKIKRYYKYLFGKYHINNIDEVIDGQNSFPIGFTKHEHGVYELEFIYGWI